MQQKYLECPTIDHSTHRTRLTQASVEALTLTLTTKHKFLGLFILTDHT